MSTTTETIRCIPDRGGGVLITTNTYGVSFLRVVIAPKTAYDMYLVGISYQDNFVASADVTYESAIKIYYGDGLFGAEVVSLPYTIRNDTAVGYYNPERHLWLPEPKFIPKGTTVKIEAVTNAPQHTLTAKLLVYSATMPLQPTDRNKLENFKNVGVGEKAF